MKKLLLILAVLLVGCAAPDVVRHDIDGRRICGPKESVLSGCVVIVQGRCVGVVRDDYDAMNACL